ncbi:Esterase/lipase-like protein [Halorhabdus utahensis DSM 12940]|uniref:Esterase/lipase-like protein n=1 Tax=Halorhabdus utahensis (strain DSM 12940 / JCM 11049 / AX-2) TaxID=519442 RepID=C7NQ75_HALUD|nr:alpha/beta hydrolase [Halorhabdus utahensis]ACV11819.1 Esterase/lipase-like protein [Halorhabdus utahensis DSM 12940]
MSDPTIHQGIPYADRESGEMKLDLYVPERENPPLVVYVHGGGWIAATRSNIPDPAKYAAEWGCAIASVSYRLQEAPDGAGVEEMYDPDNPTPRGSFPDHFVDVKAAIRWLRAHAEDYGYDADQIAAWGSSAGGHLALLAGVVDDVTDLGDAFADEVEKTVAPAESGAVQAVISWYGATDFRLIEDMSDEAQDDDGLIPLLLGGPQSEHPERWAQASPVTHVTPESPPALLMHGRKDEVVAVEHSRQFFDALENAGVDAVFYELHDLNHVWVERVEEIEGERVAMDLLAADPTHAQSVYEATHVEEGGSPDRLFGDLPPAGPEAILEFLERTIK